MLGLWFNITEIIGDIVMSGSPIFGTYVYILKTELV